MASEIKLIAQPRNGGPTKTFDYKPGAKHPADAKTIYKLVVDGKEELPVGTKIIHKGNGVLYEFPDGQTFELTDWWNTAGSGLVDLSKTDVSAAEQTAPATPGNTGQSSAALADDANTAAAGAGEPGEGGVVVMGLLGAGLLAVLAGGGGGGGGNDGVVGGGGGDGGNKSPPADKSPPVAGVPDRLSEDFVPVAVNATTLKATDDRSQTSAIVVKSVTIKSVDGFTYTNDGNDKNDDVKIVQNPDGTFSLQLTESGANKFGTVTTTVDMVDAAGNHKISDVVFTVVAVNDAPVNSVIAPVTGIPVGTPLINRASGLALSVADVDEVTGPDAYKIDSVTITVDEGHLKVSPKGLVGDPNPLKVVGVGSNSITLTGDQAHINDALTTLEYSSGPSTAKDVNLAMTSVDKGKLTDVDTVALHFTESRVGRPAVVAMADLFLADGSGPEPAGNTSHNNPVQTDTHLTSLIGEINQSA